MNMIPVSNAWYCRNFYSSFFGRARVPVVIEVIPPVELPKEPEPSIPEPSRPEPSKPKPSKNTIEARFDYWDQFQPEQVQQQERDDDSSNRLREQDYFEQLDLAPESRHPDRYGWDQYDR
jgi:hypothetical protein